MHSCSLTVESHLDLLHFGRNPLFRQVAVFVLNALKRVPSRREALSVHALEVK